jgi:serine/threonine protein kinase
MEKRAKIWPVVPKSIFTQTSDEETNQVFRDNPFHGCHKHGPECTGDVRAIVFPLTRAARTCCEAEPKEDGDPPFIVQLRMCKKSTYFSIGTSLTGNLTLPAVDVAGNADWVHPIEARIYPDPDNDDVELFNCSINCTIWIRSSKSGYVHRIDPDKHFRLGAGHSWAIKITGLYTFGLILVPSQEGSLALIPERLLRKGYTISRLPNAPRKKRTKQTVRSTTPEDEAVEITRGLRHIELPRLAELVREALIADKTFEVEPAVDAAWPSRGDDPVPLVLFKNDKTTIKQISYRGIRRMQKIIRSDSIHQAAWQWKRETQIIGKLSHPHIIRAIEWNSNDLSINFEYGGKDLAFFRSATNMFSVAINLVHVQMRIWTHATSALAYLHKEQIKHCDIKAQNILLSDDHQTTKLIDFGNARHMSRAVAGGGTHCYIAPEFMLGGETSAASDIWALGITMLFVLNIIPLPGTEPGTEVWQISKLKEDKIERRKMRRWLGIVTEAIKRIPRKWSALREMLELNPEMRITAADLMPKLKVMAMENIKHRTLLTA